MKKDAYWFSHDSNAKDDPKILMLIDQLGLEGYGIYWVLIETLREQPGYSYPVKMLPILAKRYYTSGEKMLAVVKQYDLFIINDEMFFFSETLNRRLMVMEKRREHAVLAGKASAEKRKQLSTGNDGSTVVELLLGDGSTIKVKKSIVKYIKEEVKETLRDVVLQWLLYKKERRDKPYGEIGLKKFVTMLEDYSNGEKETAQKIIDKSMASNWQGIFPLKEENKSKPSRSEEEIKKSKQRSLGFNGEVIVR